MSSNVKMVGVFIDISNLYYCLGKKFPENNKLNYAAYLEFAVGQNASYCAKAYGIETAENEANKFKSCLKHYGYEPIYKTPRVFDNNGKKEYRKTSWNVGLAMDVVRHIDKLDIVVIGSSDPELVPLVDWIKQHGRECNVVACGISRELKVAANSYKEIGSDLIMTIPVEAAPAVEEAF